MTEPLQPWGGEFHLPRVVRRLLRRPEPPGDTPERVSEEHQPEQPTVSVRGNAARALFGSLPAIYEDARRKRDRH